MLYSKHVADRRKYILRVCDGREEFLISNFRRVLNIAFFLLGNSPASEFYMPTFRNTLFHIHSSYYTAYEDGTDCSETSTYKIQTPESHLKERIRQERRTWGYLCNVPPVRRYPLRRRINT
jgi:hypothetical protein